jgi:hypothetical protein
MDNVQNCDSYVDKPWSQPYGSYVHTAYRELCCEISKREAQILRDADSPFGVVIYTVAAEAVPYYNYINNGLQAAQAFFRTG